MERVRAVAALAAGTLAGTLFFACSSSDHNPALGGNGGDGSGPLFGAGGDAPLFGRDGGPGAVSFPDGSACAAEVRRGELLPLDMYVLLDQSASMNEKTTAGVTKWSAIRLALESFVNNPGSGGLGVGIQYFPLQRPGVPLTCTSHAECGVGGPCFLTTCDNQTTITPCTRDAECGLRGSCVRFGLCSQQPANSDQLFCSPIGSPCQPGFGTCGEISNRYCVNGIDCSPGTYATPDVEVTALPAGAAALVASIERVTPQGNTPTGPALSGAVTHAKDWAVAHPGHTVVAVLATDGLPTECDPTDIGQVAAFASAAAAGNPKIPTFVIGVFAPSDTASPPNLQQIARSGGTDHAFIVDTSGDVSAEFLKALDAIRGSSLLSCDLEVPKPTGNDKLDYHRVNLALTDASKASTELVYVGSADQCGAHAGRGWYYDTDPDAVPPTKITLCPDVCSGFRSAPGSLLSFQIGCKTIIR